MGRDVCRQLEGRQAEGCVPCVSVRRHGGDGNDSRFSGQCRKLRHTGDADIPEGYQCRGSECGAGRARVRLNRKRKGERCRSPLRSLNNDRGAQSAGEGYGDTACGGVAYRPHGDGFSLRSCGRRAHLRDSDRVHAPQSEAWGTTPAGAVTMPPLNGLMVIWWAAMSGSYSLKILFAPLSHDTAMEFTPAGVGRPVPVSM